MRRLINIIVLTAAVFSAAYSGEMSFTEFQYCYAFGTTIFNGKLLFFNGDTLWGWVHSNDQIGMFQSPVFYGPVTTSASSFEQGPGYNPWFAYPPIFNYPPASFPTQLTTIRDAATLQGQYIENPGGQYQFRLLFKGQDGGTLYRWPAGFPFNDSTVVVIAQYWNFENTAIFIEGELEVLATDPEMRLDMGIQGRVTVGASGNIWIMDNLRYVDSVYNTGMVDSSTTNCLGLASEHNIIIANTIENGRDNGAPSTDEWRNDVILNGAFMALGESFSFEDQNDDTTAYGGTLPEWYYSEGTTPDERGLIHLWGSLSQYRRGYVHRSNHGGTGYLKDYHYYCGISLNPPPFFPYVEVNLTVPDSLDFGTPLVGTWVFASIDFANSSMDTIGILNISFSHPDFSVYSITDSLLSPLETGQITVLFHPQTNIVYSDTMFIQTDYGDIYNVTLTADVQETGVNNKGITALEGFKLIGAYPNPFNSSANIQFSLGKQAAVELSVYNIFGELVYSSNSQYPAGVNNLQWNAASYPAGVYLYRIKSASASQTGKLLLLK